MGCKSSKGASKPQPAAGKQAGDSTLLTAPAGKAASEQGVVHRMMRIPIKPDSVDRMLDIVKGPGMLDALKQLKGLMDLEITKVPQEDVIFTHSRWQDKASMQAAEAKIGEMLKPLAEHFNGAPQRFYATGGAVQLSGETLWSFSPDTTAATAAEVPAEKQEAKVAVAEEELEPAFKLMAADEEVAVDAEQVVEQVAVTACNQKQPAQGSWLFSTCCIVNN